MPSQMDQHQRLYVPISFFYSFRNLENGNKVWFVTINTLLWSSRMIPASLEVRKYNRTHQHFPQNHFWTVCNMWSCLAPLQHVKIHCCNMWSLTVAACVHVLFFQHITLSCWNIPSPEEKEKLWMSVRDKQWYFYSPRYLECALQNPSSQAIPRERHFK